MLVPEPVNVNCCESVTVPPPSARPPQENKSTWLPGARRGSKFRHALVCTSSELGSITSCEGAYEGADDVGKAGLGGHMLSGSEDVPLLALAPVARRGLHRREVLAEVS